VTVRAEHRSVEVTTYRVDGAYHDHRRPDTVVFTPSLEEDLRRRDFTVNAMALDLWGNLRDPFGGQADLKAGILRCVGEPDRRLEEDALRIMRGLRFAAVLGFRMERTTAESIHTHRELLGDIAAERIQVELFKLLCGKDAAAVLREYPDVLGVFWPELLPMVGFDQRNRHHCYDVWEHTLHAVEAVRPEPVLRCAMLLHDVGKPRCFIVDEAGNGHFYGHPEISRELADDMLRRLKCSTEFRETVVRLVAWHDRNIPRTDKGIRRALRALGRRTCGGLFSSSGRTIWPRRRNTGIPSGRSTRRRPFWTSCWRRTPAFPWAADCERERPRGVGAFRSGDWADAEHAAGQGRGRRTAKRADGPAGSGTEIVTETYDL